MVRHFIQTGNLKLAVLACLLLFVTVGCSSTNLGNIDETEDPRENMSGPGVLANEQGESPLTLETGGSKKTVNAAPVSSTPSDEKTEFEQFRKWDDLRTHGAESPEYQEFLEWIKYQKFKAEQ